MKRILVIICSVLLLTGCTNYKKYTNDELIKMYPDNTAFDFTEGLQEEFDIQSGIVIMFDNFNMYYYTTKGLSEANELYNFYKDDFKSEIVDTKIEKEINKGVFNKYTLTTNGNYFVVIRIGTYVLEITTTEENISDVTKVLNVLGY